MTTKTNEHCLVARFVADESVDPAVQMLIEEGFTAEQVSVVKKGDNSSDAEQVAINPGDDAQERVAWGAGTGTAIGALAGFAVLTLPVAGPVLLAGPIAAGATGGIVGGFLGSMLGWGVTEDTVADYEQRIRAGEALVIVYGRPDETAKAHRLLQVTQPAELKLFADSTPEEQADD